MLLTTPKKVNKVYYGKVSALTQIRKFKRSLTRRERKRSKLQVQLCPSFSALLYVSLFNLFVRMLRHGVWSHSSCNYCSFPLLNNPRYSECSQVEIHRPANLVCGARWYIDHCFSLGVWCQEKVKTCGRNFFVLFFVLFSCCCFSCFRVVFQVALRVMVQTVEKSLPCKQFTR